METHETPLDPPLVHVLHAYHYGPYGTYKIRNSDKTNVFLVVVSYTDTWICCSARILVAPNGLQYFK